MDDIDRAAEREEIARAAAQSARKPEGPLANGECHWCEERIPEPMRWCNADCRNKWEAYKR